MRVQISRDRCEIEAWPEDVLFALDSLRRCRGRYVFMSSISARELDHKEVPTLLIQEAKSAASSVGY